MQHDMNKNYNKTTELWHSKRQSQAVEREILEIMHIKD